MLYSINKKNYIKFYRNHLNITPFPILGTAPFLHKYQNIQTVQFTV